MNIEYEYQIANMDVGSMDGVNDYVMAIHYRVIAKCAGVGIQPVYSGVADLGTPSAADFIEFSNLTQEHVEQWLKDSIDVSSIESALADEIAALTQANSVVQPQASKLPPWVSAQ